MIYYSLLIVVVCVYFGLAQRVGNPDDTAKIERPCPTYDTNCIRDYFARHSHCKKTFGPVPDPYIRTQSIANVPRVNLTITILDEIVGGLNGRIEEFYINRDTDNLVIAVEFRLLQISSKNTYFTFHRRAKEPVVTVAEVSGAFGSIIVTGIIPKINNLRLDRAECTAFSNDFIPAVIINPNVALSSDPQTAVAVAVLLANIPVDSAELLLNEALFFFATYIQYNICDFGLQVL